MAEQPETGDNSLQNSNDSESENIPNNDIISTESELKIINQENDNMEVYHKHHHDLPEHKEKLWKHYVLEFFMLFLAVTLGFFVENKREHYIEHKRAEVFAKSMVVNLQKDTAELVQIVEQNKVAVNYLDTFLSLVLHDTIQKMPSGELYWYGLWGGYFRGFQANDATFQQMKSSGSLRYFTNHELEQNISNYDQLLRSIYLLNQIDQSIYLETRKARAKVFDFRYNIAANRIIQENRYQNINQEAIASFVKSNPPLLTTDKALLNEYIELCRSRNLQQQTKNYKEALYLASTLITQLKEEYHLK